MEFNDNKPIYLQIADRIMDMVISGEQPPGSRLPSVRDYAVDIGVNPNTVMRTFTWLQQQNLIFMKRGIGYFVADNASTMILDMRREYFFRHQAEFFMERLASFGITPGQLEQTYREYLENRQK